jgi:general secretion pathway protein G
VIVILAILAAIVVFAVGGINDKGQTSACQADRASVETAEEAFYATQKPKGFYTDMTGLVNGGFLHEASTMHDVTLTGGPQATAYQVTNIGSCA